MKNHFPWLEMALLIGLPVAVLLAGALTTAVAMERGFTPVETAISAGR
ncbi:MAG TPA: hypothetical protein VLI06_15735 [Solimonas sp.]|nr:hypothetical protein [Solimonas sp.]